MTESEADLGLASGSVGTAAATPSRYRKKPVVIEAVQYDGSFPLAFLNGDESIHKAGDGLLAIDTLEGTMTVSRGDWIIRGVKGELYPCKPDIFAATYEPADAAVPTQPLAAPKSSPSPAPVSSEETP